MYSDLNGIEAHPEALYVDGGVMQHNPSHIGGTWAWCAVDSEGERIAGSMGFILAPVYIDGKPCDVSNNLTEFMAAVQGLEAMPAGWNGVVCTDSQVTLGRLSQGWALNNLPKELIDRGSVALQRLGSIAWILLDGHPTKAQLKARIGKRGNPVSVHNVWCDQACTLVSQTYQKAHGLNTAPALEDQEPE